MLRMAEGHCADAQDEASRVGEGSMVVYVRGGGVQLGEDEESDGEASWCSMSRGRSVPELGGKRANWPADTSTYRVAMRYRVRPIQFGKNRVAYMIQNRCFSAAC